MNTVASAHTADEIAARYTAADAEFKQAVEDRVYKYAADSDLLDENGDIDPERIVERAYEELVTKEVVNIDPGNDDRYNPATSSTKEELAASVFTGGPTAADAERNPVERVAYDKCLSLVWNHTVPTQRGRIQKRLEADKLLLVRGKVYRNGNTIGTGVFVTKNPELVVREYLGPRLEKLRKLTEALEADFDLALERDKSLEGAMSAAIESAVAQAAGRLPVTALGAGGDNGQKALGK